MKKLTLLIAFICAGALAGAPSASAASIYDDIIQTTDKVEIKNSDCSYSEDWSLKWVSLLSDPQYWTFGGQDVYQADHYAAYQQSFDTGSYIVTQIDNGPDNSVIRIYYSPHGLKFEWFEDHINLLTKNGQPGIYKSDFQAFSSGGCTPKAWTSDYFNSSNQGYIFKNGQPRIFIAPNVDLNLPTDYAGVIPPETFTAKTKVMPNASIHVRDIDIMLAFDPNNGVGNIRASLKAPNDDYVFKDKVFSDFESWATQVEVNQYGIYTLTADYFVPIPYIIPENIEPVRLEVEININGDQFSIGTSKLCNVETGVCESANEMRPCITTVPPGGALTEEDKVAPYLNIPNCIDSFFTMQHMLAFKTVKFGQAFTNPNECHELGVVGNWLNLDNKTVCANFPADMRNIITPFVVFALALTILAGITRYRGNA